MLKVLSKKAQELPQERAALTNNIIYAGLNRLPQQNKDQMAKQMAMMNERKK